MGGEARTSVSNDFKALEAEMNRRHEGEQLVSRRKLSAVGSQDVHRDGSHIQVHDGIHQGHLQAERRRRQGEDLADCTLGQRHGHPWRGV